VALSLVTMFCDNHWQCFVFVRQAINTIISPLYFVADAPATFFDWANDRLATHEQLLRENVKLKNNQLLLSSKIQRLDFLDRENKELKSLLRLTPRLSDKYIGAEIVAVNAADFARQVVVNQGKNSGVYVGQPVLDAYGIIGQVVMVDAFFSRVMLVTDSKSAIPVIDTRNGMRTMAIGSGDPDVLELAHLSDTADIKAGDILVTSGIGVKLPPGYAVGVVSKVEHIIGERFAKVTVVPYARVNSSRYVVMLWTEES
jgi:rod shape-determining protein MreC